MTQPDLTHLQNELHACRRCADRFAQTQSAHSPRPIVWFDPRARILIAGQAPGKKVHLSGRPFSDPSGDRLRHWMGVEDTAFYDPKNIAIVPMAFCFPGYNAKGADLPPPAICARTWRQRVLAQLPAVELLLLVGGYAQKYHLGPAAKGGVTATVSAWRDHLENGRAGTGPAMLPLPHPSWRNTGWIRKNSWFETGLLPELQRRVGEIVNGK